MYVPARAPMNLSQQDMRLLLRYTIPCTFYHDGALSWLTIMWPAPYTSPESYLVHYYQPTARECAWFVKPLNWKESGRFLDKSVDFDDLFYSVSPIYLMRSEEECEVGSGEVYQRFEITGPIHRPDYPMMFDRERYFSEVSCRS